MSVRAARTGPPATEGPRGTPGGARPTTPTPRVAPGESRPAAPTRRAAPGEGRLTAPGAPPGGERRPSRDDAAEALGRAFKEAVAAIRRLKGRETHHPGELSYAQYGLLFALADGQPRPAREVAHAAGVSPATAAEMLDSLAAAGLVERIRSAEDKRIVLTSLTDRGRALIKQRRSLYEPRWREALSEFSRDELLTAAAVLDHIRAMFDQLAGGCPQGDAGQVKASAGGVDGQVKAPAAGVEKVTRPSR